MKLKFKATAQDWLIFGLFAVLLLFLVALVVANMSSIGRGEGLTLNIFDAFIHHFGVLMMFYIFALIFLGFSVKSYFFEREKGLGLFTGEKENKGGYSRWAKEKEIKQDLKPLNVQDPVYNAAGFPLINDGKTMYVDDGESHNLVIGSTGTGKTQCIIHPLVKILAKRGESMIVTDPKGEIYRESAGLLKQRGYKIVILNFREPQKGNTWNPLALPYSYYKNGNTDKAMELLDDVAANILYEEGGSKDPFWEKTSADFFTGLALGLFKDGKPEEVNINSISLMATLGEEKFAGRSTYIKEYFNDMSPDSSAYTSASGTVFAPEETKGSILSTFKQKIKIFASRENLSEMLASSDFDMSMIGKQKTAVFMIIQDEKKTYHALATIFIKQCYESLIDVAQNSPKGELPVRTNFILDEFQNMPPLKDITTMVAAARSRRIRLTMIIQNFAGLDATYSKEVAQTIRSNCNNLLYLLTTELAALKEISELCGEVKVKVGKGDKEHEETRPLITVSDLQKMKKFEAIIIRVRQNPFRTRLKPNFEIDWNLPKMEADQFVQRERKEVKKFNIKEFVKSHREDKLDDMMNNKMSGSMGSNPFVPGAFGGANPFGGVNPFSNEVPAPKSSSFSDGSSDKFNIDELVKKIDQKIAELEEEEKREQEELKKKEQNKDVVSDDSVISDNVSGVSLNNGVNLSNDSAFNEAINSGISLSGTQPVSGVSDIGKKTITDDQFFDDFFDD